MGRTQRRRRKRKYALVQDSSLGCDENFQQLVQWMKCNGWLQMGNLIPVNFPTSGRGLKTLRYISNGDIVVNIPGKLLMTVETASKSLFSWLFKKRTFLSQQVLAAHLAFEKHLADHSFWVKYINALPQKIATPVFTSPVEINALPEELFSKINSFKINVSELYKELFESISPTDNCPHCKCSVSEVFTLDNFLWAWFIINSRAVYICPERNSDHDLQLSDPNCLALAPYLDIFNHSNEAKVQAFVSEIDKSYRIRTLAPFKKYSQVFIHYGDHSNLKLYLEYGFIIPKNIHDTLNITFDEVYSTVVEMQAGTNISKMIYTFLKSHDLLTNLYLSADGLSWGAKVLIYVLLSSQKVDANTIQLKVYSNNFTSDEIKNINKVGMILVNKKCIELKQHVQKMVETKDLKLSGNVSESFLMAIDLYNEYLSVLLDCEQTLK